MHIESELRPAHCGDCREGSRRIEGLLNAPSILDPYGGTPHVLFRKDRMRVTKGNEVLNRIKVDEDSPSRAYAGCCNSYMYLDVPPPMHWVPIHRARFKDADVPPIEMRINAKAPSDAENAPTDVPSYPSFPLKFVGRLLSSWFATFFRR